MSDNNENISLNDYFPYFKEYNDYTFFEKVTYKYYRLREFLKINWYNLLEFPRNFKKWFKIIWNDRDYDYHYLLIILENKLKYMSKSFEKSPIEEGEKISKDIEKLREAIERLIKDDYVLENCEELLKADKKDVVKYYEEIEKKYQEDLNILKQSVDKFRTWWW